jgi:hypothetical protein
MTTSSNWRRPGEEIPLQPLDLDGGRCGGGSRVGERDAGPVDRCHAPAEGCQPDRVRPAAGRELEGGARSELGDGADERLVRTVSLEIAATMALIPVPPAHLICHR